MRYSTEPKVWIHVKGCGCLSFAKDMGINATKACKTLGNKYSKKHLDSAKKSTTMQQELLYMQLKLLQTERFKKQQKQLMIWLVVKLLMK